MPASSKPHSRARRLISIALTSPSYVDRRVNADRRIEDHHWSKKDTSRSSKRSFASFARRYAMASRIACTIRCSNRGQIRALTLWKSSTATKRHSIGINRRTYGKIYFPKIRAILESIHVEYFDVVVPLRERDAVTL